MSEDSPSLEEVANALPQRPLDASETFQLVLSDQVELLFLSSSTIRLECGVRVGTVAGEHVSTGPRYLPGWSAEDCQWVGINEWTPDEFQEFQLEYDIDDWLEQLRGD